MGLVNEANSVPRKVTRFALTSRAQFRQESVWRLLFAFVLVSIVLPTAWAGGPDDKQLTTDGFLKRDPVFWPGGEELMYTVERESGHMRIVSMRLADGEIKQFHDRSGMSDRELSVSRDGKVYAYNAVNGLSSRIRVVDKIRQRDVTMPRMGKKSWSNWPSVSPDGSRVLFVQGAAVIYSYDLTSPKDAPRVSRLSPQGSKELSDYWPRFSPDGKTIVFVTNRDDDFEIYRMDADGGNRERLTTSMGIDMHPSISPDGRRIAFTSNRDGNYEIYLMNVDGTQPQRFTNSPERDDFACWTLDGKALVYVSERDGRFDLFERVAP